MLLKRMLSLMVYILLLMNIVIYTIKLKSINISKLGVLFKVILDVK